MRRPILQILMLVAFTVVLALAAASCGGGAGRELDSSEPVDRERGRQLFQTSCRICHTLADANAAGVFGPDLDQLQPDAARVREQIDRGGGGMPDDILRDADADLVARYVAKVAGTVPDEEGERDRGAVRRPG